MAKSQVRLTVGAILIAAGAAALVYGIYLYNNLQASIMNQLEKAFVGSTNAETQAILFIAGGGLAVIIALVFLFSSGKKGRGRKKRR